MTPHRRSMRGYPVLGYAAIAGLLAMLLPSGLSLPNSGPPTVAEYAPVPGQGAGASDQGNLGQAGNGLGAGNGQGSPGHPPAPPSARPLDPGAGGGRADPVPNPFFCVKQSDGVFHQTDDPLSPPCVTYVPRDNGGPTGAPGVTKNAIVVVMTVGYGGTGNTGPKHLTDCTQAVDPNTDNVDDELCKGFYKFFQKRYNTYGRTVHLFADHGLSAPDVIQRLHPFAWVSPLGQPVTDIASTGGISLGFTGGTRASFQKDASHLMSFWPDTEDRVALTASYVCRRLGKDHPASFASDPTLKGKPRKYGFWSHDQNPTPEDQLLIATIGRQCGIHVVDYGYGETNQNSASAILKMKNDNITTVIFQEDNGSAEFATTYASKVGWYPEWVVPGQAVIRAINTNFYGRLAEQTEWRNAVGITFDRRRDAPHEQPWYRAYRQGCGPGCPEPTLTGGSAAPTDYDTLQMLYTAIQLGGPRLTAESVDKGLHAIPELGSSNPYRPAAYFAPGNYTFVKDATAIWWDPSGHPPGESTTGCYRLVDGGRRWRAGEWPLGDTGVTGTASDPCQGDTFIGG